MTDSIRSPRGRQLTAIALILAGALFGFVLAAGLSTTAPGFADQDAAGGPVRVASVPEAGSLPDFAVLAEAIRPAVVSIQTSRINQAPRSRQVDPFEFFFGPRREGPDREPDHRFRQDSTGSGFVVSADGLVVTNHHVVDGADSVQVTLGGRPYKAEVRGTDQATDVALLQIEAGRPLPYLELGDSEALRVGEWVMVVGSPLRLEQTVTVGVVSAKHRTLNVLDSSFENFIQTDAAINFGNSGGPLVNLRGQVVGIATLINWGAENIGFAVPVSTLEQILPQLRETGSVRRGYLGVLVQTVDWQVAEAFELEEPRGVLVTNVIPGGPAAEAGLRHGDIVLEVDGEGVADTRFLIDYVSAQGPGESVTLRILRAGEERTLTVSLGERPGQGEAGEEPEESEEGGIDWLGIRYQDLTPAGRQAHGLPEDLDGAWVTSVDPTSPLWDEGIRNGAVIHVVTEVNGKPVSSVREFEAAVQAAAPGSRLRFYVRRFGNGEELPPLFVLPRKPQ
ncbi:MAG TPA: Do family serine endopeptidase [Thermoanaerobaculia bacterium]|nr:Do family serine endopeptidase [Thermoanaerobaculia bacterium]